MADPGVDALDGRTNNSVLPWRPVELYRKVKDSRQRATVRKAGPTPGAPWATPSTLDEITCLAEDLSVVYVAPDGSEWTVSDMLIEVFKAVKGLK